MRSDLEGERDKLDQSNSLPAEAHAKPAAIDWPVLATSSPWEGDCSNAAENQSYNPNSAEPENRVDESQDNPPD